MFDSKEIFEYLSTLSDLKGSNAYNFGFLGKRGIFDKLFNIPLKNKFYFLFYFFLIIIKRHSYQKIYTSHNKKILIFDHSGKSIKKNLKLKSPIIKIFVPRIYIIKELFRNARKIKELSDYSANEFDRLNLIYFIKTCFEINFCCQKYKITNSIISDDITPQSMALIYTFNINLNNANIELFNIPGALFNGCFNYYEKNIFRYFDKIWYSSYDLKYFTKYNFKNRKKKLLLFSSYGNKFLDFNNNEKINSKLNSLLFENLINEKKIYFVLSSNYIRNEFSLIFIFKYTIEIYRSLCELQNYFEAISQKMYVLTHPSNSFSQILIKILGFKKFIFKNYSSSNYLDNNVVMIGGNTSCLLENLIKGGISIYISSLDYYPECYGLDNSKYVLKTKNFDKANKFIGIFERLENRVNKIKNIYFM